MVFEYKNGEALIEDQRDYLNTNPYQACFFFMDAPLLKECDERNYALKVEQGEKKMLALSCHPYSLQLFGDAELVPELTDYLFGRKLEFDGFLCSEEIGDELAAYLRKGYNLHYWEALAMDFMEAREITEADADGVEIPTEKDLDEICELISAFIVDCGLDIQTNREKTEKRLPSYRIVRRDGKIAAMCLINERGETDQRISEVYTRPEYRGKGLARAVVNCAKNEILRKGLIAALNVDKKNPISNHLYESLGFKKVFSQGEYRRVERVEGGAISVCY